MAWAYRVVEASARAFLALDPVPQNLFFGPLAQALTSREISTIWSRILGIGAFVSCSLVGRLSHGSWRGRRLGGCADAEIAPGARAWCEPARPAARLGPGAD